MTRREVSTRIFESNDMSACLQVFDSNVPDFFHLSERREFETFLHSLPGPYLVLEADFDIVGCGGHAVRDDGRIADLCWGMIRRDLHGQGLGRHLTLARLEQATRDKRVQSVALSTSQHTVRFYEKLGFGVLEVIPDGFGAGLDRIDMRRDLGRGG